MSSWKDNERYKIQGKYFEEENVILFKIKETVIFDDGTNNHDSVFDFNNPPYMSFNNFII